MTNFDYIELIRPSYRISLPNNLILDRAIPKESILIRLLSGTLGIKNNFTEEVFFQKTNYAFLGKKLNHTISVKRIKEILEPPLTIDELNKYLNHSRENNKFFELLIDEYNSYFFQIKKGSHTAAFLHLYRIIEYISYSFPLFFSSHSRNYFGTFNAFKEYFTKEGGELAFYDKFQEKVLEPSLLESELEINFTTIHSSMGAFFYKLLKKIVDEHNINTVSVAHEEYITIQYRYLLKLAINIRNRFFHFAVGSKKNISQNEIIDSDMFFALINEDIANWVSVIYVDLLNRSIPKYI